MPGTLLVGACEIDITPPIGTALAGSLEPRESKGIDDPLYVKAIVLESEGVRLAYVILDLIFLSRKEGDECVKHASERTGIPVGNIVWAASHTHTGPYTGPIFGSEEGGIDKEWLKSLPEKYAECVARADNAKTPVRMSRVRGYEQGLSHNRRLCFKDGREINTWLLDKGEEDVQCIGAAGPIDPEIGMVAFDDEQDNLVALLFQFTLHTNTNFGECFSADYPGVVAGRIREEFGPQCTVLYMPGACADINTPGLTCEEVGNRLANVMIKKLKQRVPRAGPITLGSIKKEITVSFRDLTIDQEGRIRASQWPEESREVFRREREIMRQEGATEEQTVLQVWHIGDVGFASLPGELFVQLGMKIKQESPFPWTYPVELGGDYLGYLVTEQAWKAGGYESLIARSAKPGPEGVSMMVDEVLAMLADLYC